MSYDRLHLCNLFADHMDRQKARAVDPDGLGCTYYQAGTGRRCVVGSLIGRKDIELLRKRGSLNVSVVCLPVEYFVDSPVLVEFLETDVEGETQNDRFQFLMRCQVQHDEWDSTETRTREEWFEIFKSQIPEPDFHHNSY